MIAVKMSCLGGPEEYLDLVVYDGATETDLTSQLAPLKSYPGAGMVGLAQMGPSSDWQSVVQGFPVSGLDWLDMQDADIRLRIGVKSNYKSIFRSITITKL